MLLNKILDQGRESDIALVDHGRRVTYADLKKDGTVAKWNCEINLFPKNVPVLDFKKINLKKLKPDVIFFHNPYDVICILNFISVVLIDVNQKNLDGILTKLFRSLNHGRNIFCGFFSKIFVRIKKNNPIACCL